MPSHSYTESRKSDEFINYIIESTICNAHKHRSSFNVNHGKILIIKNNISNPKNIPYDSYGECLFYNSDSFAYVNYSIFYNNTCYDSSCLICRNFNGTFDHLNIKSNNCQKSLVILDIFNGKSLDFRDCNIIENHANRLFEASENNIIKVTNCYFSNNAIEFTSNATFISNSSSQINIVSAFSGNELCKGDPFVFNKFVLKNISIENENYPFIEKDENISAKIFVLYSTTITNENISIESWIDNDYNRESKHIQQIQINSEVKYIHFEHNLNDTYGQHTLNVLLLNRSTT